MIKKSLLFRNHILFIISVLLLVYPAGIFANSPNAEKYKSGLQQSSDLIAQLSRAFESSSNKVSASVVSIIAEQRVQMQNPFGSPDEGLREFFGDDFFRRFFGQPEQQDRIIRSMGSGVVMSRDGYILTNSHVVSQAQELSVILPNKDKHKADVIGTDPLSDIAVIKIDSNGLEPAQIGDSDTINVGQWVIAVGNPFQLMHTVTAGIISAKGRSAVGIATYEDFIQTDASINPGNSGGALADLNGDVIGINTAIASPSGGNIGIGFAIPIKMARQIMKDLIENGKVIRGYLGIWLQDVTSELAKALDLDKTQGALVSDVEEDGPADQAGLQRGDVIVEFGGESIENSTELQKLTAQTKPGTEVNIIFFRDGQKMEKSVTLKERKSERQEQKQKSLDTGTEKLGLVVQNLTSRLAERLGYQGESGVLIVQVSRGSEAAQAGLQRGDLIQEVNKNQVENVEELKNILQDIPAGEIAALLVRRGENTFFVTIEIPQ